jgi:DNA-3-methyladenine glycosylase II
VKRAVVHLRAVDPVLRTIIDKVGPCRIQYREPEFETLARAVVYQQLHGAAAAAIFGRVLAMAGNRDGRLTARSLLRIPKKDLRAAGLSAPKITYLRDLAEKTAAKIVRFDRFPNMEDAEIIASLTQVKGIGVWTAHMFLLFALRRPDVLPVGDYGVRTAVRDAYKLKDLPTPAELEAIARPWRPYCSFASWYLWRSREL